ncbi:hypothetical protein JCM19233_2715 [Vibrio astriarenae]|nr:hypothetical protein JCM19233_2715 [Vibrio sp. C7]
MQTVGLSTVMLGQGIPFIHMVQNYFALSLCSVIRMIQAIGLTV